MNCTKEKRKSRAALRCLWQRWVIVPALCVMAAMGVSCSDNVDESNLYSFTGDMVGSYLQENEEFSDFYYLLTRVKFSDKSSSTIADLLSARGNYTCFVPTNDALRLYIDSIYHEDNYDITLLPDSVAEEITRSCIIDNDDQDAYLTTTFVEGTLENPTMGDRFITVRFTVENDRTVIILNNQSRITRADIEVENGVIHVVDRVLSFSNSTLPDLLAATDNMRIFSHLLEETGWAAKMLQYRDMDYELNHEETGPGISTENGGADVDCPPHRNYGYTAFVEKDSVLEAAMGVRLMLDAENEVTNWDEVMSAMDRLCRGYYPEATSDDITSEDNAINQFVSYHLVGKAVTYDKMVIHYNEIGMAYTRPENLAINAWEYYETMGKQRRMLKVTEGRTTAGKRINRYVEEYDLANYTEISVPRRGILVTNNNDGRDNNALNGYYYPIEEVLWYDDGVPNQVLSERMRHDVLACIPELTTNGIRRLSVLKNYHIPNDYSASFYASDETNINYLSGYGASWKNYQGDEMNCEGQYDIYMRMPPVPYAGTYEIRIGISMNNVRGMCQLYLGNNPENLPAIGLPVDMRLQASDPSVGFEVDDEEDETVNFEIDKRMRLHGYMKAPEYFGYDSSSGTTESLRNESPSTPYLRRIIYTGHFEPDEVYWLRFKSVLESTRTQFYLDIIEIVPKSIYNGSDQEDRW